MKIQYASDLHLEFADNWRYLKTNPLSVTGDILLLAGDIGYLGDDNYSKHPFWDWASENYKHVICCLGNHEFYKYYDIATLKDGFSLEIRPNVHGFYNSVAHIEDIDIIVSTMWSEIPLNEAYYYMNKELKLRDRLWICPDCGSVLDRDLNAAKNILRQGIASSGSPRKTKAILRKGR